MDDTLAGSKLSFTSQDELDKFKKLEEVNSITEASSVIGVHHRQQRSKLQKLKFLLMKINNLALTLNLFIFLSY